MRKFFRALSLSLGLLLASSMAFAGPSTDVLKSKQTALAELLQKNDAASKKKITAVFDELLDYDWIAKASLGKEWDARTDAEKAQFSDLLKQLVRKSYEKNLKKTLGYSIEYLAEEAKDGAIVVKTKAVSKSDAKAEPVEINYDMAEVSEKWRVRDITTEGVSLVSSYRSQFTKIIKKDGFPALIQKMKDKLAKGDV